MLFGCCCAFTPGAEEASFPRVPRHELSLLSLHTTPLLHLFTLRTTCMSCTRCCPTSSRTCSPPQSPLTPPLTCGPRSTRRAGEQGVICWVADCCAVHMLATCRHLRHNTCCMPCQAAIFIMAPCNAVPCHAMPPCLPWRAMLPHAKPCCHAANFTPHDVPPHVMPCLSQGRHHCFCRVDSR